MKRLTAEALGTFCLVFAGTAAIIVNQISGGQVTHPGIALVFGLTVMALINTFGDVSGAHFNPAVTVAFAAAGRLPWAQVLPFSAAQLLGAFAASGLLRLLFPTATSLGETLPSGSPAQSFLLEIVLATVLMLVILSVSSGAKERGITAGISIGGVVALEALFAGPISGASMNPARSLAPALISGHLDHLWIYCLAPLLGTLLAVPLCRASRPAGCCGGACAELPPSAS